MALEVMKKEEKTIPFSETEEGLKAARKKLMSDSRVLGIKNAMKPEITEVQMQVKKPVSGSSEFKKVELKSDSKPISASSEFKHVELKSTPEAKVQKPLSKGQIDRVVKISERNGNDERAIRVLNRMKKRNIED